MRKIFTLFATLATIITVTAAEPDFAYPRTTLDEAISTYESAIATPEDSAVVIIKSLLEIANATAEIDNDSLSRVLPRVDKAIAVSGNSAAKSLLMTVKAIIINNIYLRNRWKYDRTDTPDDPLPDDLTEWNGRQFKTQISRCVTEALKIASNETPVPLSKFSDVVTVDRENLEYFPTVKSFIALKAVDGLSDCMPAQTSDSIIYAMIADSRPHSPAYFYWTSRQPNINGNKLEKIYSDNRQYEASGYVLEKWAQCYSRYTAPQTLIASLEEFIDKYPTYRDINSLKNALTVFKSPTVSMQCDVIAGLNEPFNIRFTHSYTSSVGVDIYRLSDKEFNDKSFKRNKQKPIESVRINVDPLSVKADTVLTLRQNRQGYYAAVPVINGERSENQAEYFRCMPYIPAMIDVSANGSFIAADYKTGEPFSKVSVAVNNGKESHKLGTTGKDGYIVFDHIVSDKSVEDRRPTRQTFDISYNGFTFNAFGRYEMSYLIEDIQTTHITIMSDRALYHPGDSIKWAAIINKSWSDGRNQTIGKDKLKVQLFDTNGQCVDSATTVTDNYGRAFGGMLTPENGLTGYYRIKVTSSGYSQTGFCIVEVSDFKLPTFKIGKVGVSRDAQRPGEVTLTAKPTTFAGMPVAGAKVEAEIYEASRWRWFSPMTKICVLDTITAPDGLMKLVVPDSVTSRSDTKCLIAKITVTSAAGEAQKVSCPFTVGKPYMLQSNIMNGLVDTDKAVNDPISAWDASGNNVTIDVDWWLTPVNSNHSRSKAVASGRLSTSGKDSIELKDVAAGEWILSAAPVDTALADNLPDGIIITTYNIKRDEVPANSRIFIINNTVETDADGNFSISFGVPDDAYIYQSFASGVRLQSVKGAKFGHGFHTLNFKLPEKEKNGSVELIRVVNGETTHVRFNANRKSKKLTLRSESMRDRLTPGETERWTLRLNDSDSLPTKGAMIATMFNSALNTLRPYSMPKSLGAFYPLTYQNVMTLRLRSYSPIIFSQKTTKLPENELTLPNFNPEIQASNLGSRFYFTGSANGETIRVRGLSTSKEMAVAESADEMVVGYARKSANTLSDAATTEYSETESEEDAEATGEEPTVEYRNSEVLQAFWEPTLTFDSNGEGVLSFTVPNANTTWAMRALAWTREALSADMDCEFIASKPVMVTPSLPRFMRSGDTAGVLATVYNNCDSTAFVKTVIEIFDTATGEVSATFSSTDTIDAKSSAIVPATITAGDAVSAIGYRVRSSVWGFTDGEQNFIPILPSSSDVIESSSFYLGVGTSETAVNLPDGKNVRTTLDYTANPAWNVIKELPGLYTVDATTSTGAARRLFAALTATGLMHDYPELAKTIKKWSDNPDSKALVSRLSQNEELKTAALNSTPWVQAATNDTQRMARLSLLFDKEMIDKTTNTATATLKQLQNSDGGWSWGTWNNMSSVWATDNILLTLGRLNAIDYLPSDKDFDKMTAAAIAYHESKIPESAETDGTLTYLTVLFPDAKIGVRGQKIVNATVKRYLNEWKKASTSDKAIYAQILAAKGYKSVAGEITKSISQFAVSSPERGTSFPSVGNINDYADLLFAFGRIDPKSKIIDGMRQWLINRQQTTIGLGSCDPTRLIAAYASTGSGWLSGNKTHTVISAGGKEIALDNVEFATGHIVTALPRTSGKLIVKRDDSSTPAYGSVISQFTNQSSKIKAKSSNDLSIEKRITVMRNGQWQYADDLRLGEQVRVILTIKAKRDLEYVTIIDERPAALEPVDQLAGYAWSAGCAFYRENRDSETRLFVNRLPKGTYQITIDMTASTAGDFTSGIASIQSQLTPSVTAHSSGSRIVCK